MRCSTISKQPLELAAGDRRGRLVHDEHARIERQRPGDLDRLALGDGEHLDRQADIDLACGGRSSSSRALPVIAAQSTLPPPLRLAADEDVLGHREVGKERRMLVDDGDAVTLRVGGAEERYLVRRP